MIPSDAVIAGLCAGIYAYADESPVEWDHFDAGEDDGICWALKRLPGFDVIVFRGSTTPQDWARDFHALPQDTRIGIVHAGFYMGMEHAWKDIRQLVQQPVIVAGHSLGAARASIMTALMIVDGVAPMRRVVFGEPKPGFQSLADIVNRVPGCSYRNGDPGGGPFDHDLVTDVPLTLRVINFVHPSLPVDVNAHPSAAGFKAWGVFAYHHIELYLAALLKPQEPTVPIST